MNSIFGYTPSVANIQQENNVAARKPGLSTRKPLADRKVYAEAEKSPNIQTKETPSQKRKPSFSKDKIFVDVCSYKDVPDNYADVMINDEEIDNIASILFGKGPKTPPHKNDEIFEPHMIESKGYNLYNYDADIESITSMDFCGLDMFDATDPPLPTLDFL